MPKDTEYANLRGAYQYLDIEPLTIQQETFILTHMRGMTVKASANAVGMNPSSADKFIRNDPRVPVVMDFFRTQLYMDARITLEMLNSMTLEAHRKSATATEEFKGIETLAKLNQIGGFAPTPVLKLRAEQEEKDVSPGSTKELERMDEQKLIELADLGGLGDGLDPVPVRHEAEEEVEDYLEGERGDNPPEGAIDPSDVLDDDDEGVLIDLDDLSDEVTVAEIS